MNKYKLTFNPLISAFRKGGKEEVSDFSSLLNKGEIQEGSDIVSFYNKKDLICEEIQNRVEIPSPLNKGRIQEGSCIFSPFRKGLARLGRRRRKGDFIKMSFLLQLIIFFLTLSCENYVTNLDIPANLVADNKLNHESQLPYLVNGVKIQFARTQDNLTLLADALSDAFVYGEGLPDAVFEDFKKIDRGDLGFPYDNTSVEIAFADLGELRFYADDLIRRTNSIKISNQNTKNEALFSGYLYGAIARYFYATYFALDTNRAGGVINCGPFIPADSMYHDAINRLQVSLAYTDQDYRDQIVLKGKEHATRTVHSLIARCYLYKTDFSEAAVHAALGLIAGDQPFQALYYIGSGRNNYWWEEAGKNRTQFIVDERFKAYYQEESARVPLAPLTDYIDSQGNYRYYFQDAYPDEDSPIIHISWQENHLMRAELAIRGYDSSDPVQLINEVRSSYTLNPLTVNTSNQDTLLNILIEERDKELFTRGARLVDQRRFNHWHLAAGSWRYLPITQRERNANPNIE
jgi:hypothetical protein